MQLIDSLTLLIYSYMQVLRISRIVEGIGNGIMKTSSIMDYPILRRKSMNETSIRVINVIGRIHFHRINLWRNICFLLMLLAAVLPCNASGGCGLREGNSSLRYSPDSNLLAFAYGDNARPVRLLDLKTGGVIKTFPVEQVVSDLAFSPNGELLAASIFLSAEPCEGIIRVWNIWTGKEISYTKTYAVFFISFLEDNKTIVYSSSNDVEEWNIEDGTTKESDLSRFDITHSTDPRGSLAAISSEKRISAIVPKQGNAPIIISDTETNEIIVELPIIGTVQSLFFSDNGDTLAVLVRQGKFPIQLWNTNSWTIRQSFDVTNAPVEGTFNRVWVKNYVRQWNVRNLDCF